jgi:YesN/AraC family two-component response regulator
MTGSGDDALKRQAMEIGCLAYLLKPFSAEVLKELLATLPSPSSRNPRKYH